VRSYIEAIILLDDYDGKRYVDFYDGINIITGESKTGKSALVEIIDYCLCNSRCTVPKGKITDFATIFALIIVINAKRYIIARKNHFSESKKMFFAHLDGNVTYENIDRKFFSEENFCDYKTVQKEIEKTLGLRVVNFKEDADETKERASLRHMTSYLFQHQNLMASKFALFYRFDDYQKKKDVIQQFPIFAGMVGQEYYSTLILKNKYIKEKKRILANQVSNEKANKYIRDNLLVKFNDYYALIGQKIDETLTLESLIQLANKLPEVKDNVYESDEMVVRYNQLKEELEALNEKKIKIDNRISNLDIGNENVRGYISSLEILQEKSGLSNDKVEQYICPLCKGKCTDIDQISVEVKEATSWLNREISLSELNHEKFYEEKRKLIDARDIIIKDIRKLSFQIKNIKDIYLSKIEHFDLEQKIIYSKLQIHVYVETINIRLLNPTDTELQDIQDKIDDCDKILKDFNLEKLIKSAKIEIDNNMNKLKDKLDFEDEFKQYKLSFDLDEFELALLGKYPGQKVTLSQMGSGANWVSCHIALFLSMLRYFTSQENSPMPLIMFFDQPSQVYFPQDSVDKNDSKKTKTENEQDKKAVTKMYKVMFDEIEAIYKDTGIKPQLIIVDHVNSINMQSKEEEKKFEKYTRRDWRGNEALI
jgi:hypothetical protein